MEGNYPTSYSLDATLLSSSGGWNNPAVLSLSGLVASLHNIGELPLGR